MDRSLTPGIAFSADERDQALSRLEQLASSPVLKSIYSALGSQSDLYLVGGSVRDAFCGRENYDLDLATVLEPEQCSGLLASHDIRVVETGLKHGTLTAVIGSQNVEITTFRKPGAADSSDFSSSILEDLGGRDFTINAMAWSFATKQLLDPYDGLADLKARLLRATGDPMDRLKEDPLRLMRMLRLGPAQDFEVESNLLAAARKCAALIKAISVERVKSELEKILTSPCPAAAMRMMTETGLMAQIIPELLPSLGFEQNRFHSQDVFEHTLSVIEACPPDCELRLAALFHDAGKPATLSVDDEGQRHFYEHEVLSNKICRSVMRRLRFSNDQINEVSALVRHHMRPVECGPAGLRRIMRDLGPFFDKWRLFKFADAPPVMSAEEVNARMQRFDNMVQDEIKRREAEGQKRLAIDGYDLIEIGFKPGPELGAALRQLEEIVIEDPTLNSRENLLSEARKRL